MPAKLRQTIFKPNSKINYKLYNKKTAKKFIFKQFPMVPLKENH